MSDAFGWASIAMGVFVAITLGMSVADNFRKAAMIQSLLALMFLTAYVALTYLPPPPNNATVAGLATTTED
jgi:hypothetical protein